MEVICIKTLTFVKPKNSWNAFEQEREYSADIGPGFGSDPARPRLLFGGAERTIISSIKNRIAVDVSTTTFEHVRVDDNGRYLETINSSLNQRLNVEANIDQTGSSFMLDVAYSLLDEGCVAIVPVDTKYDPLKTESYEILSLRVGKIVSWYPQYVDVMLYNENNGQRQTVTLPKSMVGIVENPFYEVMNETNSTLKRLVYKLGLLDQADARTNSTKLDMIVQLPYSIRTETQTKRAETRRKEIEFQLTNSKYGIAYIDAAEHVTQLNRPVENTLQSQINDLTNQLYSQLSIDQTVLNGTASAETMNNYYQRLIAPIIKAITDEMTRKFLSKTARSQHQTIMTFQDPFRYLNITQIATLVDSLSRNEVLTGNEFRTGLGFKPSSDPSADELRNKNLIAPEDYGVQEDPLLIDQNGSQDFPVSGE